MIQSTTCRNVGALQCAIQNRPLSISNPATKGQNRPVPASAGPLPAPPLMTAGSHPGAFCFYGRSLDLEVAGGFLASVRDDLILDMLTLVEGAEAGLFNGRDV